MHYINVYMMMMIVGAYALTMVANMLSWTGKWTSLVCQNAQEEDLAVCW